MRKTFCLVLLLFFVLPPGAEAATLEDAFSPRQGATDLIVKTIGEARTSICVAAYLFTSHPIAAALVKAHARGVDVRVVLDGHQDYRRAIDYMDRHGIATRFNDRYAIMHDKFMIVDRRTLETGSFNFTRSAEDNNAENVLVVHDSPRIVADYRRQWNKLWAEAARPSGSWF
ncbi:MAG TPA: phospholipase D family protein [Alphaproteobacteria bacterium]|nr:phospholipase D family protein [Alphaproteobacteria bacterium]